MHISSKESTDGICVELSSGRGGGGGWCVVLCRVSSSRDRKNLVGAVGQEVWQQEYMLASEQIVWSARWKVCW